MTPCVHTHKRTNYSEEHAASSVRVTVELWQLRTSLELGMAYSSAVKMEAVHSSEKLVQWHQTIRYAIPEHSNLRGNRHGSSKPHRSTCWMWSDVRALETRLKWAAATMAPYLTQLQLIVQSKSGVITKTKSWLNQYVCTARLFLRHYRVWKSSSSGYGISRSPATIFTNFISLKMTIRRTIRT